MKKAQLAIMVILILSSVLILSSCSSSSTTSQSTSSTSTQTSTNNKAMTINMVNFTFDPASVTISKGETITWNNKDSVPHQVAGDNGEFQSQLVQPGGTYKNTFSTAGTINYHCSIHPSMTGTITVQ